MSTQPNDRDELVEELRDHVRSLERRLADGEESRKRADEIITQLTQANGAMSERLRELEGAPVTPAPSQATEEAFQEPAEEPTRAAAAPGVRSLLRPLVSRPG